MSISKKIFTVIVTPLIDGTFPFAGKKEYTNLFSAQAEFVDLCNSLNIPEPIEINEDISPLCASNNEFKIELNIKKRLIKSHKMITRVTVSPIPQKSFENSDSKHFRLKINQAQKILNEYANTLERLANLCSFIEYLKNEPTKGITIQKAIGSFFPETEIKVTTYTKKRRTYSIPYCTITEEDI